MSYVIYNKETTIILKNKKATQDSYETAGAAKAALTRSCKYGYTKAEDYAVEEIKKFRETIEKTEVRHGIVGSEGKEFTVPVNTPWTSGPWSESYWCN